MRTHTSSTTQLTKTIYHSALLFVAALGLIGCGLPPEMLDGKTTQDQSSRQLMTNLEEARPAHELPMQSTKPLSKPLLKMDTTALSLDPHLQQQCNVVMEATPTMKSVGSNPKTPTYKDFQRIKEELGLDWEMEHYRAQQTIAVRLTLNNTKLLTPKSKDYLETRKLSDKKVEVVFQPHTKPGQYNKLLFLQDGGKTYKLQLCYLVYH